MNSPHGSTARSSRFVPRKGRQSGVALIIVLGFLVLITVLIVAYFASVTTETSVSKTYANGATTKFLSDAAVNVVMGQIAAGTQGQVAGSSTRLTWASQPGMIRTFDDSGNPSSPNNLCYKLYSSSQMVISGDPTTVTNTMAGGAKTDTPTNWNTQPAIFTDLNEPVADSTGVLNYPIMSGSGLQTLTVSGSSVLTYYSGPPVGTKIPDIEGVSVSPSAIPNYNSAVAISGTNNPVQMPVQWIYMLQDGTLISPDSGGNGSTATFKTASSQPSAKNPIVGRMAFWTDDETCKLNINTASEGTYYAFPRANTQTDLQANNKTFGFAISPPATGEYNRYPGHPATTCLSVALGKWLGNTVLSSFGNYYAPNAYTPVVDDNAYFGLVGGSMPTLAQTFTGLSAYMLLSPRTSGTSLGGSLAGTVNETGSSANPVATKSDRLYGSLDELTFRYPVSGDSAPRTPFPNTNLAGNVTAKSAVEKLKFFLTASSRAPELTPFNTPKVSIWPQWSLVAQRSAAAGSVAGSGLKATEALLAFCSSFGTDGVAASGSNSGKNEYFFQRYTSGLSPSSMAQMGWFNSTDDWNFIPRNQQLANYLYQLGSNKIPGYGAAFAPSAVATSSTTKYTKTSFSSLLVETLDMIRCTDIADYETIDGLEPFWNVYLPGNYGHATTDFTNPLMMSGTYTYSVSGTGALPTTSGTTTLKGFGGEPVCTQVALGVTLVGSGTAPGTLSYQPHLVFQFFDPADSFPQPNNSIVFSGTNFQNLGLPPQFTGTSVQNQNLWDRSGAGLGYEALASPIKVYDYYGSPGLPAFALSGTPSTINIGSNSPVTFAFMDGNSQSYQNISVTFPPTTIPAPTQAANLGGSGGPVTSMFLSGSAMSARGVECRSPGPLRGDWRLLACLYNANQAGSQNIYTQSNPNLGGTNAGDYSNQNYPQVHSLRIYTGGGADALSGSAQPICIDTGTGVAPPAIPTVAVAGSLVSCLSGSNYTDFTAPCVPAGMTGTNVVMNNNRPGDWDTGPGLMPDGPYINPTEQWNCAGTYEYLNQNPNAAELNMQYGQNGSAYATFSPNRYVSSPVRFGSLPTGVDPDGTLQPWQTLLFCPNPPARQLPASATVGSTLSAGEHAGFANPPDHLYLEFLTMPVVQPYAISEPLSTAGKVNLNYQIAPFTYIERSTALRGVLKNTLITAISGNDVEGSGQHPTPATEPASYKFVQASGSTRYAYELRYDINRDATVAGIDEHYFSQGLLFMYPSQICDVFLVPQYLSGATASNYNSKDAPPPGQFSSPPTLAQLQATYDGMVSWWNPTSPTDLSKMSLTGENLREEPYDHLYPRLTTKSNTYTVHCRVQVLKQTPADAAAGVWTEGTDQNVAEYRGSSLIERYVDPNNPELNTQWDSDTINLNVDATKGGTADLSRLYKFRVISTKKFAP